MVACYENEAAPLGILSVSKRSWGISWHGEVMLRTCGRLCVLRVWMSPCLQMPLRCFPCSLMVFPQLGRERLSAAESRALTHMVTSYGELKQRPREARERGRGRCCSGGPVLWEGEVR